MRKRKKEEERIECRRVKDVRKEARENIEKEKGGEIREKTKEKESI